MKTQKEKHTWMSVELEDDTGELFQGYVCTAGYCQYLIVAYPKIDQPYIHDTDNRLVIIKEKTMTDKDADKWMTKLKVHCPPGGNRSFSRAASFKSVKFGDRSLMRK